MKTTRKQRQDLLEALESLGPEFAFQAATYKQLLGDVEIALRIVMRFHRLLNSFYLNRPYSAEQRQEESTFCYELGEMIQAETWPNKRSRARNVSKLPPPGKRG
jgi:hypothetical protein